MGGHGLSEEPELATGKPCRGLCPALQRRRLVRRAAFAKAVLPCVVLVRQQPSRGGCVCQRAGWLLPRRVGGWPAMDQAAGRDGPRERHERGVGGGFRHEHGFFWVALNFGLKRPPVTNDGTMVLGVNDLPRIELKFRSLYCWKK